MPSIDAHARLAGEMLESYEREMSSLHGSLLEAEENLDNTRCACGACGAPAFWHMPLPLPLPASLSLFAAAASLCCLGVCPAGPPTRNTHLAHTAA